MEHARRGRPSSRRSSPAGARRTAARGRDTASTRGREAARAAPGRPTARTRRGNRQEPPSPLRGRARPAQPPAHEGTLARVAPRRADLRPAVARSARRRVRRARCSTAPSSSSIAESRDDSVPTSSPSRPTTTPCWSGSTAKIRSDKWETRCSTSVIVAGIGNLWKAESLWHARVSPWRRLAEVNDAELRATLEAAHRLMRGRLDGAPGSAQAYRRKGRPCPRCGTAIKSWPQGDDARMAYWCPECQRGEEPKTA